MTASLRTAFLVASLVAQPAFAGEISTPGDALEVESYRCVVTSPRTISCLNIGRVCEEARAKEEEANEHYLGCGLEKWQAEHPKESCPDMSGWHRAPTQCLTQFIGGW